MTCYFMFRVEGFQITFDYVSDHGGVVDTILICNLIRLEASVL